MPTNVHPTARALEERLALYIVDGIAFTADDVTGDGTVTFDGEHTPNGGQNGIGSLFRQMSRRRVIEWTGIVVRSRAPHRKGGMVRVWRGTDAGRLWATTVLAP